MIFCEDTTGFCEFSGFREIQGISTESTEFTESGFSRWCYIQWILISHGPLKSTESTKSTESSCRQPPIFQYSHFQTIHEQQPSYVIREPRIDSECLSRPNLLLPPRGLLMPNPSPNPSQSTNRIHQQQINMNEIEFQNNRIPVNPTTTRPKKELTYSYSSSEDEEEESLNGSFGGTTMTRYFHQIVVVLDIDFIIQLPNIVN